MKKALFILLATATMGLTSYGQGISWGPRVGVNVSTITNLAGPETGITSAESRLRPNFGLFADYRLGTVLGLQVEAMYSMQGAKLNFDNHASGRWSVNYLNVPILLKFYLLGGLNLQSGIQFDFLISSKFKKDNVTVDDGSTRGMDMTVPIGLSYEFPGGLTIDARYGIDISRVNKYAKPGYKNYHNSVWAFTLGWKF